MKELLEKIRNLRLAKGYTQEYMAEKIGIDTVNYGRIERGQTKITMDRFFKICEILEISPSELLRGDENEIISYLHKIFDVEKQILEILKQKNTEL